MKKLFETRSLAEKEDSAKTEDTLGPPQEANDKVLSPEARRALAEAKERRQVKARRNETQQKEINGRDGPEPARYGDWEVKGIATDF
jgi:hypothetical protein